MSKKPARKPARDWGRSLARLICLLFALIGAVPLSGGAVLQSEPLKRWAASETSRLLSEHLGLTASFEVELSFIPLRLAVKNLSVPDLKRKEPALSAELVAVSPRFFSLLAGRIDVGDIELENSNLRLELEQGKILNIAHRFPQTSGGEAPELNSAPFRSLAVTNANIDVSVDGMRARAEGIDLDAFAEEGLSFDIALRSIGAHIETTHQYAPPEEEAGANESSDTAQTSGGEKEVVTQTAYDEDHICALDLRAHVSQDEIAIRRLALMAAVDVDPQKNTEPACSRGGDNQLALRLSQVKIVPQKEGLPHMRGHVMTRAPLSVLERLSPSLKGSGWTGFSGTVAVDGSTRIPEINGTLSGDGMRLSGYNLSDKLKAEVLVTGDVVRIPQMSMRWGNGESDFYGIKIEPFVEGIPYSLDHASTREIDLPGVLRDIDMTDNSWVSWNFGSTEIGKTGGTMMPFTLDGSMEGQTHDFVVWDRSHHDPLRRNMMGIKRAHAKGRFRANTESLDFYNCDLTFGSSSLPVEIVSIGFFPARLTVKTKEGGGALDLADISPIADVEMGGKSHVEVLLQGPMEHPTLKGKLQAEDLTIAGFKAGHVEEADVHFEPLFVEFNNLKGQKGHMDYEMKHSRLSFDGPATVEFTGDVQSEHFSLIEFLDSFHFDEDPRFAGMHAEGSVKARLRYLMGGPEDRCETGRLTVDGSTEIKEARLLDEGFSGGNSEFFFEWFDIDAGLRGMRLDVPSLTLRKGSGAAFGSVRVSPGGQISGDLLASRIPISRFDSFDEIFATADGFVTATTQLGGTVDAPVFSAHLDVTQLKSGKDTLPPSYLEVTMRPGEPSQQPVTKSKCGHAIIEDTGGSTDQESGDFLIAGELFGGQIAIPEMSFARSAHPVLKGQAQLNSLDLGELSRFFLGEAGSALAQGVLSGNLKIDDYFLDAPFRSHARLELTRSSFQAGGVGVELEKEAAALVLDGKELRAENLALVASTKTGQEGVLDVRLRLNEKQQLDAALILRPTDLAVVASALPTVERADGELSAEVFLKGPLQQPVLSGFVLVKDGKLTISGVPSSISKLQLKVDLDRTGLHLRNGEAQWGGGDVHLRGELPLTGGNWGRAELDIGAKNVQLPIEEDVAVALDAKLKLTVPAPSEDPSLLPALSGTIDVLAAHYNKHMSITADISSLTSRGVKTEVSSSYTGDQAAVDLDLLIRSGKPITVKNELVEATLRLDPAGLRITGTDEEFGAVGTVEVEGGGKVFLRRNEFELQDGLVRFNDPTTLRPEVDVSAVTEYRRYANLGASQGAASGSGAVATASGSGNWRILMHAYGPPDDLKVDLSSDPPLAQDDIFLLLTVGLTRTELDQSRNSGVGSSVALEALGTLSGAEGAVTDVVPVDEFRFGSTYSSRSGRTEPTVTIGKRLSDRIRASVTTSLSETSEVRSNVEYRATENVSLEGSFDNARNVASAAGGNIGGDVRWRLEFK